MYRLPSQDSVARPDGHGRDHGRFRSAAARGALLALRSREVRPRANEVGMRGGAGRADAVVRANASHRMLPYGYMERFYSSMESGLVSANPSHSASKPLMVQYRIG